MHVVMVQKSGKFFKKSLVTTRLISRSQILLINLLLFNTYCPRCIHVYYDWGSELFNGHDHLIQTCIKK